MPWKQAVAGITFPASDADLPHPGLVLPPPASQEDWSDADAMSRKLLAGLPAFSTRYDEGLDVDYKWYDARRKPVLFPFGFGLSYTSFAYTNLDVRRGDELEVSFSLTNTGTRAGDEIAQVYATLPASAAEPPRRLVGWSKVSLQQNETKRVVLRIPARNLQIWDETLRSWRLPKGEFVITAGPNSRDLPLQRKISLGE